MKRILILALVLVLAVAGVAWWRIHEANSSIPALRTAAIERGDLTVTITATGTFQPEEVIDVGAQVAGRIVRFGRDPHDSSKTIDYNTLVDEGTELAFIDEALYRSDVDQARANLTQAKGQEAQAQAQVEQAQANITRAEADLVSMKVKFDQAEREWNRVQRLAVRPGAISDTEYDQAKATFESARASVGSGEAALVQAKKALKDSEGNVVRVRGMREGAEAALDKAKTNLGYCTIKSPIKGIIIDRRVNVGQTVVASLNAPSLFLIAKDLKKIQLWAQVNEADINLVHEGQPVRFTVDARPGETFSGTVTQVRYNATMTQNVVTYTVVITTDNSEGKLRPYQTANGTFEVAKQKDVLKVPNSALRWQPRPEQVDPDHLAEYEKLTRRKAANKLPSGESREGLIWLPSGERKVRPVKVKVGLSDGMQTEVSADGLSEDDQVVVGVEQAKSNGDDGPNALQPRMFNRPKQ